MLHLFLSPLLNNLKDKTALGPQNPVGYNTKSVILVHFGGLTGSVFGYLWISMWILKLVEGNKSPKNPCESVEKMT
jgi:hypothetical protein